MNLESLYIAESGRCIRIDLQFQDGIIEDITISGDFHASPQALDYIETALIGSQRLSRDIRIALDECITTHNINMIGITKEELRFAIMRAQ